MEKQPRGYELYAFLQEKIITGTVRRLGEAQRKVATEVANEVCDELVFEWGGQNLYLPMSVLAKLSSRNAAILAEYNGRNRPALARKHGLSEMRIHQIIQADHANRHMTRCA